MKISVVIATYGRGRALTRLIVDLAEQTLAPSDFEVIVVDDGSREPAAVYLDELPPLPFDLRHHRQVNAGPAVARHKGIQDATGEIVVIVDDDMRLPAHFLSSHLATHDSGAEVSLGYIASPEQIADLPIYERFHADQLESFAERAGAGAIEVRGVHLCTGNVSFRRAAYEQVGGFDFSLGHSEDRELGVRFEKAGYKIAFCKEAVSYHESDRASLEGWLARSHKYGVFDSRISRRHPELEIADPWRFFFRINPVTRPFALTAMLSRPAGELLSKGAIRAAEELEGRGLERPALMATTFSYGMQYFMGMRHEAGSRRRVASNLLHYLRKRRGTKS